MRFIANLKFIFIQTDCMRFGFGTLRTHTHTNTSAVRTLAHTHSVCLQLKENARYNQVIVVDLDTREHRNGK